MFPSFHCEAEHKAGPESPLNTSVRDDDLLGHATPGSSENSEHSGERAPESAKGEKYGWVWSLDGGIPGALPSPWNISLSEMI